MIVFDLPHWVGAAEVMHLMSLISPLDRDLAVVYPRIAPVRLMELLAGAGSRSSRCRTRSSRRWARTCWRSAAARARSRGQRETRRRMEKAGVEVITYKGDHISRLGDGGPTCLTRPILRRG